MTLTRLLAGVAVPAVAVLVAVTAVLRARDLLPGAPRDRQGLAVALAGLALGAAALTPPVYNALTWMTGINNVGEPIARTALMTCAVGVLAMIAHLAGRSGEQSTGQRRSWMSRRRTWLVIAVGVLWTAFAAGPESRQLPDWLVRFAGDPAVLVYLVVFLLFVGGAFGDLLRLGLVMRETLTPPLSTSGQLIALGALAGCLYVVARLVGLAGIALGDRGPVEALSGPGIGLAAAASLLLVTGTLWPAVRFRIRLASEGLSAHAASTRLYPMWRDVVRLRPAVAMEPDPGRMAATLDPRNGRWHLYRRVIELRDGVRALQGRSVRLVTTRPPAGAGEAERGAERTATALAEVVAAAETGGPAVELVIPVAPAASSVAQEVMWWSRVAEWYRVRRRQRLGQRQRRNA